MRFLKTVEAFGAKTPILHAPNHHDWPLGDFLKPRFNIFQNTPRRMPFAERDVFDELVGRNPI